MSEDTDASRQRVDQWLWHARFFKTRTLAGRLCRSRKVRIDGNICAKASTAIQPGAVLTFPQSDNIRVIRVASLAARRGPASEAQALFEDLSPPVAKKVKLANAHSSANGVATRAKGDGRPTKRHRRALDRLLGWWK